MGRIGLPTREAERKRPGRVRLEAGRGGAKTVDILPSRKTPGLAGPGRGGLPLLAGPRMSEAAGLYQRGAVRRARKPLIRLNDLVPDGSEAPRAGINGARWHLLNWM